MARFAFPALAAVLLAACVGGPRLSVGRVAEGPTAYGGYLAGRFAARQYDLGAAAEMFAAASASAPDDLDLKAEAFSYALASGRLDAAKTYARALSRAGYSQPFIGLTLAADRLSRHDLQGADDILNSFEAGVYSSAVVEISRAWIARERSGVDAGAGVLDRSGFQTFRGFHELHRALIYASTEDWRRADNAFGRAADGAAARLARGYYARSLEARGEGAAATGLYRAMLAERNDDYEGRRGLYRLANGLPAPAAPTSAREGAALALFNLGAATYQQAMEAQAMTPAALSMSGPPRLETPLSFAWLAVSLDPDFDEAWALIGAASETYGDARMAAAAYERVSVEASVYPEAVLGAARALADQERYDAAAAILAKAREADPGSQFYALPLADLLIRQDQGDEAVLVLREASETARRDGGGSWRIEGALGAMLLETGRDAEAVAALRRAVELAPNEPEALNLLGYTLADRGESLEEAERLLKRARQLAPGSGAVVDSYGWAKYRLGQYEEAVFLLETAVELSPNSPVITDHLGDAYWRVGRKLEAGFEWRRALDLDPEPALREVIERKLRDGLPAADEAA